MDKLTFQIRRNGGHLGQFSTDEINALLSKGRLRADDELLDGTSWCRLADFMAKLASASPAQSVQLQAAAPTSQAVKRCYLHFKGQRTGPLELSKLQSMIQSGLIDGSATVEEPGKPPPYQSLSEYLGMALPPPIPASGNPTVLSSAAPIPGQNIGGASVQSAGKQPLSYFSIWWRVTLFIYASSALLGFLAYGLSGMAIAMGAGLIAAPIKGAFFGWIWWLIRK